MANLLIVSRDQVRARMAAPGIRCAEMARALAGAGHRVTLAIPNEPELSMEDVEQIGSWTREFQTRVRASDAVIIGGAGHHLRPMPEIPERMPLVVDMSFPLVLEVLAVSNQARDVWPPAVPPEDLVRRLTAYLLGADFLMCASEQQRDFYLGCLTVAGRVGEDLLREDPTLRQLLAVVPFGCPEELPVHAGPGARGRIPGIAADDFLLLWSGSLGDWYDPATVVRAVARAAEDLPSVRLVFMGAKSGEQHLPETATSVRTRQLAADLGLLNRLVFFEDAWVPYEERANWLCEADAAIVASLPSLESELAVRTRFLDYIWCATPLICTRGGAYASLVDSRQLGLTVNAGDADAMAQAIIAMAEPARRAAMKQRLEVARPDFTWPRALQPLLDYCAHPRRASDRVKAAEQAKRATREPVPGALQQLRARLLRGK
jgi:glycosyltransferase involved in cell wall biosynthesis